jgi:hypothetical protein
MTAAAVGDAARIVGDGVGTASGDSETVGTGAQAIAAATVSASKGSRRTVGLIERLTLWAARWLRASPSETRIASPLRIESTGLMGIGLALTQILTIRGARR